MGVTPPAGERLPASALAGRGGVPVSGSGSGSLRGFSDNGYRFFAGSVTGLNVRRFLSARQVSTAPYALGMGSHEVIHIQA